MSCHLMAIIGSDKIPLRLINTRYVGMTISLNGAILLAIVSGRDEYLFSCLCKRNFTYFVRLGFN
jgi:hypothetical protein